MNYLLCKLQGGECSKQTAYSINNYLFQTSAIWLQSQTALFEKHVAGRPVIGILAGLTSLSSNKQSINSPYRTIWPLWTSFQMEFKLYVYGKATAVLYSWKVKENCWIEGVHMGGNNRTRVGQSRRQQLSTVRLDYFLPAWPGIQCGLREQHQSQDP